MNDLKISIVCVIDNDNNILMIRRSPVEGDENSGKWEFPAGHIDPGEIPPVSGSREVKEETGLDVFLIPHGIVIPTKRGKASYYLGFTSLLDKKVKPKVKLRPEEHDKYIWVKPKDLNRVHPTHKNMKDNLVKLLENIREKLKVKDFKTLTSSDSLRNYLRLYHMKKSRTARMNPLPTRFMRRLPVPGDEINDAILVGDEVEIFLKNKVRDINTQSPDISGIVERRDRNTIWIHDTEDTKKKTKAVDLNHRDDWDFVRVYRGPDNVVQYTNGNPYDPDSEAISQSNGLGLILESNPPERYESVWALMRNETPDLDRTMGQVPQSRDSIYPTSTPKAEVPEILHQVREVMRNYGFEPDIVDSMGKNRVLILTQDKDLKRGIIKVLKSKGKEIKQTRTGSLIVQDRVAQGTTTIPIQQDDHLMNLTLRKRGRDKKKGLVAQLPNQSMSVGVPGNPQAPGTPQQMMNQSAQIPPPFNMPQTPQQINQFKRDMDVKPMPMGKGVQLMFKNPTQTQNLQNQKTQVNQYTQPYIKPTASRTNVNLKIIRESARRFRDALSSEDFDSARDLLSNLLGRGIQAKNIISTPFASKRIWGDFSRYLDAVGEIRGSRIARIASRISEDY